MLCFDAAEVRAFWAGGQVIQGVVIHAWKCKVCMQAWGLCPSLGTQDGDQTKYFERGAVFTELCVVKVTGREWQVIDMSQCLPTILETAVTIGSLTYCGSWHYSQQVTIVHLRWWLENRWMLFVVLARVLKGWSFASWWLWHCLVPIQLRVLICVFLENAK